MNFWKYFFPLSLVACILLSGGCATFSDPYAAEAVPRVINPSVEDAISPVARFVGSDTPDVVVGGYKIYHPNGTPLEPKVTDQFVTSIPEGMANFDPGSIRFGPWEDIEGGLFSQGSSFEVIGMGICKVRFVWYGHRTIPDGTSAELVIAEKATITAPSRKRRPEHNPYNDRAHKVACTDGTQLYVYEDINYRGKNTLTTARRVSAREIVDQPVE